MKYKKMQHRIMQISKRRRARSMAYMLCISMAVGSLTGCGSKAANGAEGTVTESQQEKDILQNQGDPSENKTPMEQSSNGTIEIIATEDLFSDRDLKGTYKVSECTKVDLSKVEGDLEITKEGDYLLTGKLSDGMILVNAPADAKIQLVLNNAEITHSDGAAIYVKQAKKVFVTLAEGTINELSCTGTIQQIDDNKVDGVIFSKSDLTINGTGTLNIWGEKVNGIVCKDDLRITGGSITIDVNKHGMEGKDSIRIGGGDLKITSCTEGLEGQRVILADGNVFIKASDDGINATNGESEASAMDGKGPSDFQGKFPENGEAFEGEFRGGKGERPEGNEGFHGKGGRGERPEGMEEFSGGGERPQGMEEFDIGGRGGFVGDFGGGKGGMFAVQEDTYIAILGGNLYIDAGGDGLDSNGHLLIEAGEITVHGSERGADSAIDFNGTGLINGGSVVTFGNMEMMQNFGQESGQCSVVVKTDTYTKGAKMTMTDASGNVLAEGTTVKSGNCVMISNAQLQKGQKYTLKLGEKVYEFTMDTRVKTQR